MFEAWLLSNRVSRKKKSIDGKKKNKPFILSLDDYETEFDSALFQTLWQRDNKETSINSFENLDNNRPAIIRLHEESKDWTRSECRRYDFTSTIYSKPRKCLPENKPRKDGRKQIWRRLKSFSFDILRNHRINYTKSCTI